MTHQELNIMQPSYDSLLNDACLIIEEARHVAYRAINNTLTIRNWHLGERIAREELGGAQRAEYGKRVVAQLADDLTARYGKGFKSQDLYNYISFFRSFPEISDAVSRESGISDAVSRNLLPWTHYRELIRVEDATARVWYEQEAMQEMWSTRTLHRNIASQYYYRMLQSASNSYREIGMILPWLVTLFLIIAKY